MKDEMKNQAGDAIQRPTEPRIPLMDVSTLAQTQPELAASGASNVLLMLAHRADLLEPWLGLATHLIARGRTSMRTRELLTLRVALRSSCEYVWGNHVAGALGAGMTAAEIASLAEGAGSWSDADMAVLNLVDDLCVDACASEQTWKALTAAYDEGEIIELLMMVGFYRMNAGFLNSLGVPIESGRPRLGQGMSYEPPVRNVRPTSTSTTESLSEVKPDGTWHLKFYHPAATQELHLVLVMREGELSGSLTNEAAGIIVPVSEGKVDGHQLTFTTVMTKPMPATIIWDGTIEGDFITGTNNISNVGSFPFDATRIG